MPVAPAVAIVPVHTAMPFALVAECVVNPDDSGSVGVPSDPDDARNAIASNSALSVTVVIDGMSAAFVWTPLRTIDASSAVVVSTPLNTRPMVRNGVEPADVSVYVALASPDARFVQM